MSILIHLPKDHRAAYRKAAASAGMKLSAWVRERCFSGLPPEVQAKLSIPAGPGNPTFKKKRRPPKPKGDT